MGMCAAQRGSGNSQLRACPPLLWRVYPPQAGLAAILLECLTVIDSLFTFLRTSRFSRNQCKIFLSEWYPCRFLCCYNLFNLLRNILTFLLEIYPLNYQIRLWITLTLLGCDGLTPMTCSPSSDWGKKSLIPKHVKRKDLTRLTSST